MPSSGRQASADPRASLKAGFRDAGTAARNMELVASLPKPGGFFDPKAPAGLATPPEKTREEEEEIRRIEREHERAGTPAPPQPGADNLNSGNSDLALRQSHAFVGNYHGFNVYDIENPGGPGSSRRSCAPAARVTCRFTATCCSCLSNSRAAGLIAAPRV